jgi:hypothetical protein
MSTSAPSLAGAGAVTTSTTRSGDGESVTGTPIDEPVLLPCKMNSNGPPDGAVATFR